MKKAKEVRRLQKAQMQANPRYKELETEIGELIDLVISANVRTATAKIKGEELDMVLLLLNSNGYGHRYFQTFDKSVSIQVEITW